MFVIVIPANAGIQRLSALPMQPVCAAHCRLIASTSRPRALPLLVIPAKAGIQGFIQV